MSRAAPPDHSVPHQTGTDAADQLPPEILALLAGQPAWTASATLDAGVGYKHNLLLSTSNPESSTFGKAGVESLIWHVPKARIDYFGFVNAERTEYFSASVHHEEQAFAGVEWRYRNREAFSFTLDGQGYYLDQIFDVSDTEKTRVVAELRVTGMKAGPTVHWAFVPWMWIEASGTVAQERFQGGVNNAQITAPVARVGWRPVDRIDFSVAASEHRRDYDTHPQYTAFGTVDTGGGVLAITEKEIEGRLDAAWGAARHWKTRTRAGRLRYHDNGSGFFNYWQRSVGQEVDWTAGRWSVEAEGNAARKIYDLQVVGRGLQTSPVLKEEYSTRLRVERKLTAAWSIYTEFDW